MKYFVHLDEKYFHMVSEKGEKQAQILNISKCGTNEKNQKVFTWETL
jgi:hypothetical protein